MFLGNPASRRLATERFASGTPSAQQHNQLHQFTGRAKDGQAGRWDRCGGRCIVRTDGLGPTRESLFAGTEAGAGVLSFRERHFE